MIAERRKSADFRYGKRFRQESRLGSTDRRRQYPGCQRRARACGRVLRAQHQEPHRAPTPRARLHIHPERATEPIVDITLLMRRRRASRSRPPCPDPTPNLRHAQEPWVVRGVVVAVGCASRAWSRSSNAGETGAGRARGTGVRGEAQSSYRGASSVWSQDASALWSMEPIVDITPLMRRRRASRARPPCPEPTPKWRWRLAGGWRRMSEPAR